MMNRNSEEYPLRTNMRKILRESRYEKKRLQFVEVRKSGGGERERLRRRIGGFYTLHRASSDSSRSN